jgi:hypothetical protein
VKMVLLCNRARSVIGITWVDDDRYEEISAVRWSVSPYGYVRGHIGGDRVFLHRHLLRMRKSDSRLADHIDGDPKNNTLENLRVATGSQNSVNRHVVASNSGYRGVTFHKQSKKWVAAIKVNNKSIYLGLFLDPEEAARAYDAAARMHFGEFAIPNFELEAA